MGLTTSVLLRHELGEVLRAERDRQGRTLREVSTAAQVSLGYLSEVERGLKEASSELLSAICSALRVPMSVILGATADRVAIAEGAVVPDYLPDGFADDLLSRSPSVRNSTLANRHGRAASRNSAVVESNLTVPEAWSDFDNLLDKDRVRDNRGALVAA